jgi:photosystem II stability/assembly factor-like uncharacterized protein
MQRLPSRTLCWLPILLAALPALPALAAAPPATDPAPPISALSAAATWTPVGPAGGTVDSLASSPADSRRLYAGTSGGVYLSLDRGATWTPLARRIGQQRVYALALDPLHPAVHYAGTATEGVWKSADRGASWAPTNVGLPALTISALAVDPVHTATLYAGLAGGSGGAASGPYKSTNGGRTWRASGAGLQNDVIQSLAIDPTHPATLYAARLFKGIGKSTDGGATWRELDTPFTGAYRVAVRQRPSGTFLYVVTTSTSSPSKPSTLYRSADGGESWDDITPPPLAIGPVGAYALGFGPGGLLYTKGAKSTDYGDHWTDTATFGFDATAFLVDPAAPATVYAASDHGIWRTADGAASWAGASRGLHATTVRAVAVNPASGGVLSGVVGNGLIRLRQSAKSLDPGSWLPVFGETPGFLVYDPNRPSTVYAGLNGANRQGFNRIARSTDGGVGWLLLSVTDPCLVLSDVAVDPTDSEILYVAGTAGFPNGTPNCAQAPALTFKSTDSGATWQRLSLLASQRILVDPFDPRTLYAIGSSPLLNVYKSTDAGATWHPASAGLGTGDPLDLTLDPGTPGRLLASTTDGIYESLDGAHGWQQLNHDLKNVDVLRIEPTAPHRLYAGVTGVGAFLSRNGGLGWSPLDDGHLQELFSGALAPDPTTPGQLYVGTLGAGLFRVDVTGNQ